MNFFRIIQSTPLQNIFAYKKEILHTTISLVGLILLSLCLEYSIFALSMPKNASSGVLPFKKSAVSAENFSLSKNGKFVSQSLNATLILKTHGQYINNLKLGLQKNFNESILVQYQDTKTHQSVISESMSQKSFAKSKLAGLDFAVFKIQDNPQEITIVASNKDISIFNIQIDNSYHFNLYRFFLIFSVQLLLLVFYFLRKNMGEKPEIAFLATALICGTLLSVSQVRDFNSFDEPIHYRAADYLSLKFIAPKKVNDIYARDNFVPFSYSIEELEKIDELFDNTLQTKDEKSNISTSPVNFYNCLGHLPSGVALFFGRLLHLRHHINFVLGRWINILLFSSVVFFAIRKLKSGKMIMASIALLPTSIFLASNYNYDSWVTAFTLLGFAYLFSELQQPDKNINPFEAALMIGAFVIGLGPKAIYFPLMFLLFILKQKKFKSKKQYKIFVFSVSLSILFVVGSFMAPILLRGSVKEDYRGGAAVNATEQIRFILSEPGAYSKILLNFIKNYPTPKNASGFVNYFYYLGYIYGFWVVLAVLTFAVFTDKNEFDRETANWKLQSAVVLVFLITAVLISTVFYISFTPVKSQTIKGVQPRYLIPLLFPLLCILGSSRIKFSINKNFSNSAIFGIIAFILFQGIWGLVIKKYF